ncbi:MAG TPA: glycoside hydrolase family 97 catalytic domain-containing protein [Gemmatimonadaceae bacterium]|nr:glycoside hydrolase family 97 catalytic domain-containing protein [Gemmatimonadaceae bacterium]
MRPHVPLLALAVTLLAPPVASASAQTETVISPNGRLEVRVRLDSLGAPRWSLRLGGAEVLAESRLGLVRADEDFSSGLRLVAVSPVERVEDRYELPTNKRRRNHYVGNRRTFELAAAGGARMRIVFQLSDDGVAFRYHFPDTNRRVHRLVSEATTFRFRAGTRAYLQHVAAAKTGWGETNPSYEETYERDVPVGTMAPGGGGWVFPALFRSDSTWMLVSETGLGRTYAGTRLASTWRSPEYGIAFPGPLEGSHGGPVLPQSTLPWTTPWRLVVVGRLATIVESTLGTDLAEPARAGMTMPAGAPGKASWSWPLLGDARTEIETQRRFVDYAAAMGWRYTLVDALWDKQIGWERLAELVRYARAKGVRILVWYNSAGDWNTAPQTPRDRMLTAETRAQEFARLREIGVAGLKVDFFAGDGQSTIAYYHDILEDAARHGFVMNFHGSTLPRGWHRTYPHLMTMEAVRGLEFVTFEQRNAEEQPAHAATLPFTRNVFDPMDFTPVVLDRIANIERRTSSAFELALSVLFTSGIQHYAEIPEGMAKAPAYVRAFLRDVPSVWDDVRFLTGDPGRHVVLARRAGTRWWIAGINAERAPRTLTLDLARLDLPAGASAALIEDGDARINRSFRQRRAPLVGQRLTITLQPRGGFVAVVE